MKSNSLICLFLLCSLTSAAQQSFQLPQKRFYWGDGWILLEDPLLKPIRVKMFDVNKPGEHDYLQCYQSGRYYMAIKNLTLVEAKIEYPEKDTLMPWPSFVSVPNFYYNWKVAARKDSLLFDTFGRVRAVYSLRPTQIFHPEKVYYLSQTLTYLNDTTVSKCAAYVFGKGGSNYATYTFSRDGLLLKDCSYVRRDSTCQDTTYIRGWESIYRYDGNRRMLQRKETFIDSTGHRYPPISVNFHYQKGRLVRQERVDSENNLISYALYYYGNQRPPTIPKRPIKKKR